MLFDFIAAMSGTGKFLYVNGREYSPLTKGITIESYNPGSVVRNTGKYLEITTEPESLFDQYAAPSPEFLWDTPIDVTRLNKICIEVARCDVTPGNLSYTQRNLFGVTAEWMFDKNGHVKNTVDAVTGKGRTMFLTQKYVLDGGTNSVGQPTGYHEYIPVTGGAYVEVPKTETPQLIEIDVSGLTGKVYLGFESQNFLKNGHQILISKIYTE